MASHCNKYIGLIHFWLFQKIPHTIDEPIEYEGMQPICCVATNKTDVGVSRPDVHGALNNEVFFFLGLLTGIMKR